MAYKTSSSLIAQISILAILLAVAGQALAGRDIKEAKNGDMRQPEWLFPYDHSVLIPGIGRVMVPPGFGFTPNTPDTGSAGGTGTGNSHVPGGDDTFVPNPGYDVPSPGGGDAVPGIPPQP